MSRRRGQSFIETVVVLTCVITGVVIMKIYVQRAIQGGMFGTASSLGMQFDPRGPYQERQRMSSSDTVHLMTPVDAPAGMVGAAIRGGELDDSETGLPDLPYGPIYREPSVQSVEASSSWTVDSPERDNFYCEQRKLGGCS